MSSSSLLCPVSSSSSLPSLDSSHSIAESDTRTEPSALQQPQETPTTIRAEQTRTTAVLPSTTVPSAATPSPSNKSRSNRLSPFQSFRSSRPSGPFNSRGSGVITIISFACLSATALAAAAAQRPQQERNLEDEEEEWTGEWDGEWTANQGDDYVYACGENCDDDTNTRTDADMWIETGLEGFTPDQIITYVSLGLLSFMTLMCCVCYPEIIVVTCGKICGCCRPGAAASVAARKGGVNGGGMDDDIEGEGNYVGGRQEKDEKKRKKKRRKSKTRSSSRSRTNKGDVELV